MLLTATIISSLLASQVSAFTLPGGLADGFYHAYVNERGEEIHEPATKEMVRSLSAGLQSRNPVMALPPSRIFGRQDGLGGTVWCGCGFNMNSGDCDAAVADLKSQVGDSTLIPNSQSYYSVRGSVVAFACNRVDQPWRVSTSGLTQAYGEITSA